MADFKELKKKFKEYANSVANKIIAENKQVKLAKPMNSNPHKKFYHHGCFGKQYWSIKEHVYAG